MCKDAEKLHKSLLLQNEADGPVFKIKRDPRVTKVGKFIRKTSIDELPQLLNVLKGEMTIVGPRPIVTYETERMSDYEKQRMLVKPGLTCYWQCSGRNDVSFEEWIEMDLKYIREASLLVDIKIICKTIWMVIRGTGAY
jgi:lipopolysaccharide/colanic/teichoic acid biosynthesis glycosyltransferase